MEGNRGNNSIRYGDQLIDWRFITQGIGGSRGHFAVTFAVIHEVQLRSIVGRAVPGAAATAAVGAPDIERFWSSVSIGLGGLLVKGCCRLRTMAPVGRGGGRTAAAALGIGMSALSLEIDREGPAVEPRDPGCGESALSSPPGGPSSMLVESWSS